MKKVMRALMLLVVLSLLSCGGGGGGGGSSTRPDVGFRVLHANIDAPPLDIYRVGEASPISTIKFSESSGYFSNNSQDQAITLTTSNIPTELEGSIIVPLSKGGVKTVLFFGDNESIGQHINVIDDPVSSSSGSSAMVRVIHGVVGASSINASAGQTEITPGTEFGSASDYVELPAGPVHVVVRRVSGNVPIFDATLTLAGGSVYSLFVSGDMNYFATAKLLSDN